MATCGLKLTKSERKILKRQAKARHTVLARDGISISRVTSRHLVVCNGGLGNNVQRCELEGLFGRHGDIVDITMEPEKPYAFVSFSKETEAESAMNDINGRELSSPSEVSSTGLRFYLDYVEKVPGISIPENDLPSGLILLPDIIDEQTEKCMLECINWQHEDPALIEGSKQNLKHRLVKHYGYEFLYGVNNVDPTKPLEVGIPSECQPVIDALMTSEHLTQHPDQLTVNQYEPGQGIPPHIDTHSAFEDPIVSVSLGSQVVMEFRHPDGRHIPVLLPPRSALIMSGESRYVWSHGITPRRSDIFPVTAGAENAEMNEAKLTLVKRTVRTSFTFRKILPGPCTCKYSEQCDSQTTAKQNSTSDEEKSKVVLPQSEDEAARMEALHVHEVYERIAGHFSSTRHSPWPQVAEFLRQQPQGSLMADVGCGNGKYLGINSNIYNMGCDRSYNLCEICDNRGHQVFVADALSVPLRSDSCDVVISIAVIHHLSTTERRRAAVSELVRILRVGGQALIYVWALEQEKDSIKSNYLSESRIEKKQKSHLPADEVITQEQSSNSEPPCDTCTSSSVNSHESTLTEDSLELSAGKPEESSSSVDSSLGVHVNRTHFDAQDMLVPWHLRGRQQKGQKQHKDPNASTESTSSEETSSVYHRYYHVFRKGELEELCMMLGNIKIIKSYYDKGNWCVVLEKVS